MIDELKIKAVIDFLELSVETKTPSNFQTVQRAFNDALRLPVGCNTWVTESHKNSGSTCHFTVRIHDVERYAEIVTLLEKVSEKIPINAIFHIVKIEIAIDAYCIDSATQAANFYKFLTRLVSENRRIYRDRAGSPTAIPRTVEAMARLFEQGWQIAIGDKLADEYQHIYLKTTDTHNGIRKDVKPRARIEIQLSGEALLCQTPGEWVKLRFETLSRYFRFSKMKSVIDPFDEMVASGFDQIGERKPRLQVREGRLSGVRLHSRATQADAELNSKVRNALRNLSRIWKGSGKRGRLCLMYKSEVSASEIRAELT